jgi:tRNA 2-thiouridine synthesizing protein A
MKEHFLDITADRCPMTFVKTKLLIERMGPGELARVRLKGAEPLENVPRSVREHGHEVIDLRKADDTADTDADGAVDNEEIFILTLRKGGEAAT